MAPARHATHLTCPPVLDAGAAAELLTSLWGRLPAELPDVVLHCDAVVEMDGEAARALDGLSDLLRGCGGQLHCDGMRPELSRQLTTRTLGVEAA